MKYFDIPESSICSKSKIARLWVLYKLGFAKQVEVNEENISYRTIIFRNVMYFY